MKKMKKMKKTKKMRKWRKWRKRRKRRKRRGVYTCRWTPRTFLIHGHMEMELGKFDG
jgi:cell division septal protein FtsQ